MITKKVVRIVSPEEREDEPKLTLRIDDEPPPVIAGQYIDRETGAPISFAVPKNVLAKVAGEVRLEKRQIAMFLVGVATVVMLVLAVGYFVGRGESIQAARQEAPDAAAGSVESAVTGTPPVRAQAAPPSAVDPASVAKAAAGGEGEAAAPKKDPLSFYADLAERNPDSAVAALKEQDPKKFLEESESRPVVTPEKADVGDRGLFTIQVSSFANEEGANKLLDLLRKSEIPAYILPAKVDDKTWFRVRVGQYTSRSEAEKMASRIHDDQGLPAYVTPSQS